MSTGPQQDSSSTSTALSPHPGLGPPPPRPLTKKRPHRRSPQACDECRLRKRACDASEPCRPCQRGSLKCTYQFRRPVPPPTLRIRNLQDHLSLARSWLQHVKDNTPDVPGLDLDECLRTLDFTQPDASEVNTPATNTPATNAPTPGKSPSSTVSTPAKIGLEPVSVTIPPSNRNNPRNMLAGHDRLATLPSGETCFYGAYSDMSFALRTMELFRQGAALNEQGELDSVRGAFAKPFEPRDKTSLTNDTLHDEPLASDNSEVDLSHLMFAYMPRPHVEDLLSQPSLSSDMLPLRHLYHSMQQLAYYRKHQTQTCQTLRNKSLEHFHEGMSLLLPTDQDSLPSVQALLLSVNILLLTGRIIAAHSLVSTTTSMALRLGLFAKGMASKLEPDKRTLRVQAMAGLLAVDMLLSLILDVPMSLGRDSIDEAEVLQLAQDFERDNELRTAAMLRQVCLLFVPISIRERTRRTPAATAEGETDAVMEDIRLLETAHAGFRRWKRDVSPLLTSLGSSEEEKIITKDLEMVYNFCQTIVFRSHLHHLRSVAVGGSMSKTQSYHALACLKIATSTIGHIDRPTDSNQLTNLADSWLGVYTIFSAVMCLVFLIAAHPGTASPSVAWQRAHKGIRILAACSCGNNMASACLEVVKIVTTELSHTVYFDYAEIEANVRRVCDPDRDSSAGPSPSMSTGSGHGFMDIPADRMLFQADTLKAEFDFRDILHFSDSE